MATGLAWCRALALVLRHAPGLAARRPPRSAAVSRALGLGITVALVAVPLSPSRSADRAAPTAATPAGLVLHDDGGDRAAKRKRIAQAIATAEATYETAGATVRAAAAAYAEATAALPDARQALAEADGAVIAASVAVHRANANVTQAQAGVDATNQQLVAAEARVDTARATVASIASTAYEGSGLTEINILMSPGAPTDVLERLSLLDRIVHARRAAIDGYVAARMQVKDAYNRAVDARTVAEKARTAASAALVASQRAQAAAQAAAKSVAALVATTKSALAVARANEAATLAAYQQLRSGNAEVGAQLAAQAARDAAAARQSATPGASVTTGHFRMPVPGWESSPFGMRFDPFYRRWQLHAGVDIAAARGTPIRAAASGRVIRAGWAGGYGNYTCIDHGIDVGPGPYHGEGVATCYGHESRILVRIGQHVRAGQVIGLVGETGAATGYHLHFEVRVNGAPVQPLTWLPPCFC